MADTHDIILVNHVKHSNIVIPYGNYTLLKYEGIGEHDIIGGLTEVEVNFNLTSDLLKEWMNTHLKPFDLIQVKDESDLECFIDAYTAL